MCPSPLPLYLLPVLLVLPEGVMLTSVVQAVHAVHADRTGAHVPCTHSLSVSGAIHGIQMWLLRAGLYMHACSISCVNRRR